MKRMIKLVERALFKYTAYCALLLAVCSFDMQANTTELRGLRLELHQLLNNPKNSSKVLAQDLKKIYARAIVQNDIKSAGMSLYLRGEHLLYSQQHQEYKNWRSIHRQFYEIHKLEVTLFLIKKLELSRLFHEMKTTQLVQQADTLLAKVDINEIRINHRKDILEYKVRLVDVAEIYNLRGLGLHDLGKYDQALTSFSQALILYEEVNSQQNVAIAYGNMALVYASTGDIETAINYNNKSIQLSQKFHRDYGYFKGLTNQASYKMTLLWKLKYTPDQYTKKIKYLGTEIEGSLLTILADPRLINFPVTRNDALYWLVYLYLETDNLTKAEYYLNELIREVSKLPNETYLKQVKELQAYVLFEKDQFKDGIVLLETALEFYLKHEKIDKALRTLLDISWAYEQIDEFKKSLQYYQDYTYYLEQSFNDKKISVLAIEQEKNNAKLREKEIQLLEEQQRFSDMQVSNKNNMLLLGLATMFLIILLYRLRLKSKQELADQYHHLSHFDSLTSIGNRLFFKENIEREFSKLLRERNHLSHEKLALFVLDIDHFKRLNDTYGHETGDKVLVDFSKRLKTTLRESDLFARWGGEEFVLAGRVESESEVAQYAQRILKNINSQPFKTIQGKDVIVTCSIGGTTFPFFDANTKEPKWEKLLSLADQALYKAKHNGRNTFTIIKNAAISSVEQFDSVTEKPLKYALEAELLVELNEEAQTNYSAE